MDLGEIQMRISGNTQQGLSCQDPFRTPNLTRGSRLQFWVDKNHAEPSMQAPKSFMRFNPKWLAEFASTRI